MDNPSRDGGPIPPAGSAVDLQRRPRSSVPSFLFIIFMLFMLTSHNGDEFLARHQYQDALQSLTYQLSNYTAWMNGTSSDFDVPNQSPALPPLLDAFHLKSGPLRPDLASYYSNITGFIHGDAHFYNISPTFLSANGSNAHWGKSALNYMVDTNVTEIHERVGTWNWTASQKVAFSMVEKKPLVSVEGSIVSDRVALVHGRIELTDGNTSEDLRLEFEGVHFIADGSIYGFAEPAGRHIDIRLLPSLVPESMKNETARIIEPELTARINKLKGLIDAGILDQDTSNDDPPKSTCPFTFYAQLDVIRVPEFLMQEFEEEIQKPTGIGTISSPPLTLGGLLISRECGVMYEVGNTEGLRSRTFFRKVTTYAGTAALFYLALLVLFARQTELSRTPSGISRVSRWIFLSQATIDSVSFAGHITFAILAEGRPSLSLIAPSFLACILFIYEAQFSMLVHQIQLPEDVTVPVATPAPQPIETPPAAPTTSTLTRRLSAGAQASPPPTTATTATTAATPTPPTRTTTILPIANVPQAAASPSFFVFFLQHIRSDPQARLWLILFIVLTLVVRVILSPFLTMVFVAVTHSLIWLPQIFRGARRGRSSGLSKEYILGTTACRLFFVLYFLTCPRNVLEVEPRAWTWLIAGFISLQASILLLQEVFGPSFFLPNRFVAVQGYDYHPPMPRPDSEAPEQSLGDCAICMDAIVVKSRHSRSMSADEKGGGDGGRTGKTANGLLNAMHATTAAREVYSLAPCHHLFHTECLERWLAIKNICPQCRRPLPPL
ncbi:hypothetical protein BD779DRAFT_1673890 [Infundibulicybe gibba]|nr:hypothetical protein BD779DRAFT_1673890 [Infundibulicybe gibba]